ncbi:hypothetical protein ACFL35_21165, partial [Candidatus Riflebacteria bacterium]
AYLPSSIYAKTLPYQLETGGIFLKDAAVLAGLGCMGENNLLLTPDFGPRVRLRSLYIELEVKENLADITFKPCRNCAKYCWQACPQKAFINATFVRSSCELQMQVDEANPLKDGKPWKGTCVSYCRECEFACPVGKGKDTPGNRDE